MPSFDHEGIIALFRDSPHLIEEVMRAAFDLELPKGKAEPVDSALGQPTPTERRADLVLALEEVRVIVEVQLQRDSKKRRAGHSGAKVRAGYTLSRIDFVVGGPPRRSGMGETRVYVAGI